MPSNFSSNFDTRPAGTVVDMLIFHYTGMEDRESALERLCDPSSNVSAHYLIGEDGSVEALVAEKHRAWHAGEAAWRGQSDINARSIGIELVNPGHEFGYRPFTESQMLSVEILAREILDRHPIPARNVVGHSDVAPRRKTDPGELFDWRRLAERGIGLWPDEGAAGSGEAEDTANLLIQYGYEIMDLPMTIAAFQRHFRPSRIDGVADGKTAGVLRALLSMIA
ncbi:MAG: N-acetylmuramoyl-L-alanine amidase [Rhodospirillales bacterium]|nr:N-acetylmuramoyl-L-alanine amidase [Rhodospirillales bacterium]